MLADRHPPLSVLRQARQLNAPMLQINKDWHLIQSKHFTVTLTTLFHKKLKWSSLFLPAESIGAAIVSWEKLYGALSEYELKSSVETLEINGRFQEICQSPRCIVDVAHNPQSLLRLHKVLKAFGASHKITRWIVVFSMLRRKALKDSLSPFKHEKMFEWYLPNWGVSNQFFQSEEVKQALESNQLLTFNSIEETLAAAAEEASKNNYTGVIVTGSFLTVAAALKNQKLMHKN